MADRTTPNLPSRNFEATSHFYRGFGFTESWRNSQWMILRRGELILEFFPHPDIDPRTSCFSACLRLDDMDAFYALCLKASVPENTAGLPRLHPAKLDSSGLRIAALIDPDGTLLRLIQN